MRPLTSSLFVLASALPAVAQEQAAPTPSVDWQAELGPATARAAADGQPMMVVFR